MSNEYKTDKQIQRDQEDKIIRAIYNRKIAQAPENVSTAGVIRAIIREGGFEHNSATSVRNSLLRTGGF